MALTTESSDCKTYKQMQFALARKGVRFRSSGWTLLLALIHLLVIGALLLSLVAPASSGPFSAVNGPATALRSVRNARIIFLGLILSGIGILKSVPLGRAFMLALLFPLTSIRAFLPPPQAALRC